ncbi:MAG: HEAT repeat domain-containing protein [Thermoanaerobaculia bacterium]
MTSRIRVPLAGLFAATLAIGGTSISPARGALYATADSGADERSDRYRDGQRAVDRQDWEQAERIFREIAAGTAAEADAALYWQAYAEWKQQEKKDALEALRHLQASFPKSSWLDDAQALELEIRGGHPTPDAVADDELKLYAVDALLQVDPQKALPILEKILAGSQSLELKKKALFVLSQSDLPRSWEVLLDLARNGQPPAMRIEAVRALGVAGGPRATAALAALAKETSAPFEVRAALVEAYLVADLDQPLLALAKSDPDPRLRRKAIEALGAMDALPALRELWSSETDPELRAKLIEAFGIAGDLDTLGRCARESTDARLRRKAVEGIAISNQAAAGPLLRQLYGEFKDVEDRRKVIESFVILDDAQTLVEMFRAEKDPELRRKILQTISVIGSDEALDLVQEILKEKP